MYKLVGGNLIKCMARALVIAGALGCGLLAFAGARKIRDGHDTVKYSKCEAKKIVRETKLYDNMSEIPNGFKGIIGLTIPKMTRPVGFVTIRKQDVYDGRWDVVGERMLQIGIPNFNYEHMVEGIDKVEPYLGKGFTETGTGVKIQKILENEFKINHNCTQSDDNANWNIIYHTFQERVLFFGGEKRHDAFNVDRIGIGPERIAGEMVKNIGNMGRKEKKLGYVACGIGLCGVLCCRYLLKKI
ncbi:MAG: hypothetical protein Hyperionvirus7_29 [Hyperionvirus sp.]|uniref:Uncharacterized protein n=1 Tax=Hyperionvirus sp. TaxID=2487770 RepID=A0A3G5A8B8_9VIRU|nr:MAG: hypothetical protein Hyperionvirus7_29 [Hyperionvirus sp.]